MDVILHATVIVKLIFAQVVTIKARTEARVTFEWTKQK